MNFLSWYSVGSFFEINIIDLIRDNIPCLLRYDLSDTIGFLRSFGLILVLALGFTLSLLGCLWLSTSRCCLTLSQIFTSRYVKVLCRNCWFCRGVRGDVLLRLGGGSRLLRFGLCSLGDNLFVVGTIIIIFIILNMAALFDMLLIYFLAQIVWCLVFIRWSLICLSVWKDRIEWG